MDEYLIPSGHETTASSTAWGIFAISQRPSIQSRLRTELLEAFSDDSTPITLEALNGLTYLDAVVREIFRYHPPVEFSARQPQVDDTIPLDNGFVGRDGKYRDHIEYRDLVHSLVLLLTVVSVSKKETSSYFLLHSSTA